MEIVCFFFVEKELGRKGGKEEKKKKQADVVRGSKGILAAASPALLFGRVQPLDHRLALPWLQSRLLALGRG